MACSQCHEKYYGRYFHANWLSQGHTNSFPAYRLPWQRLVSVHDMFQVCNKRIRSEPYEYGADEYVNLELYTAWRRQCLAVEPPGVR